MTLQQWRYALSLRQHGSFNKAAQALRISQPALSVQIKKLETDLDLILFERSKKYITPTSKGELMLTKAQQLLHESQQLQTLATQLHDNHTGEIRLGIIPTLAPYLIPLFVSDLAANYPEIKLEIVELLTEDILHGMQSGQIDGGIISTPIDTRHDLHMRPLFYEEIKLFVAQDHHLMADKEVDVQSINSADVWLLKEGNCFRDQVDNLCDISSAALRKKSFNYQSNSIEGLCRIVESEGGLTFLPELTTIHLTDERLEMVKRIKGKKRVREISLLYIDKHIKADEMNIVADSITSNIPTTMLSKQQSVTIDTNIKF